MKLVTSVLSMLSAPHVRGSLGALVRVLGAFLVAVVVFSVGFLGLMGLEGQEHSWWTSVYWTVVTMTTLGFGDITFETDVGRMYSVLVLLTGSLLILVMLPFTFIQYVYVPWRDALRRASAPRELPESTRGHVILTGLEPMEQVVIDRARAARVPYVLLVEDLEQALALNDQGYDVMVGALDDPETYRGVRASQAAMVVTCRADTTNTNVAFTVREVTDHGLVVATADSPDSVDVLELAGTDRVLQLGLLLGKAFARRILAPHARSSVISEFEDLVIAEASVAGTDLVGSTLAELDMRREVGVSVVGVWERGQLRSARPQQRIEESSVLILAGTEEQMVAYDDWFERHAADEDEKPAGVGDDAGSRRDEQDMEPHVIVLGGGRVGRAVARELEQVGTRAVVVERLAERIHDELEYVHGEAADREVLHEAGIETASAVVITTHDDATNVYLTLYCRRLRGDIQILGRVNVDRNVSTMHRAGADFVLSYASTGATEVWNELREDTTLLLAEGLLVFRVAMPAALAGRALRDTDISTATGCTVIGVARDGECHTGVGPDDTLPEDAQLVLIGDEEAEQLFLRRYLDDPRGPLRARVRERLGA